MAWPLIRVIHSENSISTSCRAPALCLWHIINPAHLGYIIGGWMSLPLGWFHHSVKSSYFSQGQARTAGISYSKKGISESKVHQARCARPGGDCSDLWPWDSTPPLVSSTHGEMVILVPVSCSIFFKFRPSLPINLPTRLLCARIFKGISSALRNVKKIVFIICRSYSPPRPAWQGNAGPPEKWRDATLKLPSSAFGEKPSTLFTYFPVLQALSIIICHFLELFPADGLPINT